MSTPRTLLACVVLAAAADAADKRLITETDLFRFVWVADPRISPDGQRVAFVRVSVNKKKDAYDTAIWIVPADGREPARALTNGTDTNPRWSPDGRFLAFNRSVEKDGRPQPPQLWLLPLSGGEARAVTDLPKGAGAGRVVAGRLHARVHQHDHRQGPREEGRQAGRRQGRRARERRARHHARDL